MPIEPSKPILTGADKTFYGVIVFDPDTQEARTILQLTEDQKAFYETIKEYEDVELPPDD